MSQACPWFPVWWGNPKRTESFTSRYYPQNEPALQLDMLGTLMPPQPLSHPHSLSWISGNWAHPSQYIQLVLFIITVPSYPGSLPNFARSVFTVAQLWGRGRDKTHSAYKICTISSMTGALSSSLIFFSVMGGNDRELLGHCVSKSQSTPLAKINKIKTTFPCFDIPVHSHCVGTG